MSYLCLFTFSLLHIVFYSFQSKLAPQDAKPNGNTPQKESGSEDSSDGSEESSDDEPKTVKKVQQLSFNLMVFASVLDYILLWSEWYVL